MKARIFQKSKSATQSGRANADQWTLLFEPKTSERIDTLMGWSGSNDMDKEVNITFPTMESAISFAERHGLSFELHEPQIRKIRPKSYADNFRHDRIFSRASNLDPSQGD